MEIKDKLKNRRLELGLSLNDVAQMVGVNKSTVARWENGEIDDIKRSYIAKYASALCISPAVIMGFDMPEPLSDVPQVEQNLINITKDEQAFLEMLRSLDPETREAYMNRLRHYIETQDLIKKELIGGENNVG